MGRVQSPVAMARLLGAVFCLLVVMEATAWENPLDDKYARSFKAEQSMDDALLDDGVKEGQGRQLAQEINTAMDALADGEALDDRAKRRQLQHKVEVANGLGVGLGDTEKEFEAKPKVRAPRNPFGSFENTQNMLNDDLGGDFEDDASLLGESDDDSSPVELGEADADTQKLKGIHSSGSATCTGGGCSGSSTTTTTPPPPPPPPPPPKQGQY